MASGNPYHDAKGLFASGDGGGGSPSGDRHALQIKAQLQSDKAKSLGRQMTAKAQLLLSRGKPQSYSSAGRQGKAVSGTNSLGRMRDAYAAAKGRGPDTGESSLARMARDYAASKRW